MAFYETVFIVRQDVSTVDVDKVIDDFSNLIQNLDSRVVKTEYWGLRSLAYEIANNKKGHYVLIASEINDIKVLKEFERKIKLSENIIRYLTIKVHSISPEPSPILNSKNSENEEVVNVTLTKEDAA